MGDNDKNRQRIQRRKRKIEMMETSEVIKDYIDNDHSNK